MPQTWAEKARLRERRLADGWCQRCGVKPLALKSTGRLAKMCVSCLGKSVVATTLSFGRASPGKMGRPVKSDNPSPAPVAGCEPGCALCGDDHGEGIACMERSPWPPLRIEDFACANPADDSRYPNLDDVSTWRLTWKRSNDLRLPAGDNT